MNNDEKKITKLIKVFTDKVNEEPTFLITFQVLKDDTSGEIIREKVHITNANSKHRYYGKTPVVFVRREHEQDVDVLNLANRLKLSLDVIQDVKYERELRNVIKNVLNGDYKHSKIKKSVFYNVFGEVMFKRPHVDFITFSPLMLKKVNKGE